MKRCIARYYLVHHPFRVWHALPYVSRPVCGSMPGCLIRPSPGTLRPYWWSRGVRSMVCQNTSQSNEMLSTEEAFDVVGGGCRSCDAYASLSPTALAYLILSRNVCLCQPWFRSVEQGVSSRSGDETVGNELVDRKRLKAPGDARSREVDRTVPIG